MDYEDEYDDFYFDGEREPSETAFTRYLGRDADGHWYLRETYGWKYTGQDWGETVDQWQISEWPILDTNRPFLRGLVRMLKAGYMSIEPGEQIAITSFDHEELDERPCPACQGIVLEFSCLECGADFFEEDD